MNVVIFLKRESCFISCYCDTALLMDYYAALLPRRGSHIASHSVCPSVHLSVRLSVRPVIVAIGYVISAPLASRRATQWITMTHMYFSARTEGRISYGHLGRTNSCLHTKENPSTHTHTHTHTRAHSETEKECVTEMHNQYTRDRQHASGTIGFDYCCNANDIADVNIDIPIPIF